MRRAEILGDMNDLHPEIEQAAQTDELIVDDALNGDLQPLRFLIERDQEILGAHQRPQPFEEEINLAAANQFLPAIDGVHSPLVFGGPGELPGIGPGVVVQAAQVRQSERSTSTGPAP